MTMQIRGDQEIGGVPVFKVRDWLAGDGIYTRESFIACFHRWRKTEYLPEKEVAKRATALRKALLQLGYIAEVVKQRRGDDHGYEITELGKEFSRASGAKRLKRETARRALDGFLSRIAEVNTSPRFLVRITRAVVYGSYIRGQQSLGDLDLAVDYQSKITVTGAERREIIFNHFKASGRTNRRRGEEWRWPEFEVYLFLKSRKRTISLHKFYDFLTMPKANNFGYEVLFGDPEQIKADLIKGETMEKHDRPDTSTVRRI